MFNIRKILILLFSFIVWLVPAPVLADVHSSQGEAYAHCIAQVAQYLAINGAGGSAGLTGWTASCGHDSVGQSYGCNKFYQGVWTGSCSPIDIDNGDPFHSYIAGDVCGDSDPIGPLDPSFTISDIGTNYCLGNCIFEITLWCGSSGASLCTFFGLPSGYACSGNDFDDQGPSLAPPDGCTIFDSILTCDCVANPGGYYCTEFPDPDETTPDDNCNGAVCLPVGSGGSGDDGDDDDPSTGGGGSSEYNGPCNPLSEAQCAYVGSAGGSIDCAIEPDCSGQPELCAILKQNWHAQCYQFIDAGEETPEWEEVSEFQFEDQVTTVDVSSGGGGGLSTEGSLGSGSCPADKVAVTVLGDFTVKWQPFCFAASILSYFVMFAAALGAARIMFYS